MAIGQILTMFPHAGFGSKVHKLRGKPGFQVDLSRVLYPPHSSCFNRRLRTEPYRLFSIPHKTANDSLAARVVVASTAIHTSLGARHPIPQGIVQTVLAALEQQVVILVVPSRPGIGAFEPGPNVVGRPAWEKILVKT